MPQFLSLGRPSRFLSNNYESFFFQYFLPYLCNFAGCSLPSKNDYLQQVHTINAPCLTKMQQMYYEGCINSSKYTGDI